jgi:hypothetical protein
MGTTNEPLRCIQCGNQCRLRFHSVEFYYQQETKSLPVDLREEELGYCPTCAMPLRMLLYHLWKFLKKRPEHRDLPEKWSVGVIKWSDGRTQAVWG